MSTVSENSNKSNTNVTNECLWHILPLELQEMILKFLDGKDLVQFSRTCRQFLQFDRDENMWKNLFFEKFGTNYRFIKPTNVDWKRWYFQNASHNLFPLFGVIPGKTTVEELKRIAEPKFGDRAPYYIVRGIKFWYDEKTQLVTSVRLKAPDNIPSRWEALGFSWEKIQKLSEFQTWFCSTFPTSSTFSVRNHTRYDAHFFKVWSEHGVDFSIHLSLIPPLKPANFVRDLDLKLDEILIEVVREKNETNNKKKKDS